MRQGHWAAMPAVLALLAGAAAGARVGLLDDRLGLPPRPRFLRHLAPALGRSGRALPVPADGSNVSAGKK